MKLNLIERLIVNNPLRAFSLRRIEGPMLRKMGTLGEYPQCLEIGCGIGAGAEVIAEQFGAQKVIATDFDPEQIERAKGRLKAALRDKVELKVADAMALDEPDGKFDAVFSIGVLHHLEDWRKGVGEVSRVLRTGGEFFFEEPLGPFVRSLFARLFSRHPVAGQFEFDEFKDVLGKNNIEIVNMKRFSNIAIFGVGRKK